MGRLSKVSQSTILCDTFGRCPFCARRLISLILRGGGAAREALKAMIREIAGYERRRTLRIKNLEEEAGIRPRASLVSLCLDTDGKAGESGKLYCLWEEHPIVFSSLFQAVNQMEELYDACASPQASARLRSFSGKTPKRPPFAPKEIWEDGTLKTLLQNRGVKATFWIRVFYRQHTSWQGEVTWVERQKKEYFRSTLELLGLMDSALRAEM